MSADVSWPTHLDPGTGSRSYLRDYALSTLVPVRGEGGSMSICRTLNQGATTRRKRKGQTWSTISKKRSVARARSERRMLD